MPKQDKTKNLYNQAFGAIVAEVKTMERVALKKQTEGLFGPGSDNRLDKGLEAEKVNRFAFPKKDERFGFGE
jgi:hypothetical protein